MKARNSIVIGLLALMCMCVSPALGQSDRGAITGRVTDQAGAVIPNAKVTALNVETNDSREAAANSEENYAMPQLEAVIYKVTVAAPGFKSASIEGIKIAVQVIRTVDV